MRELRPGVWEVIVYHGVDPATGKKKRVSRTVHGTARDAQRLHARLILDRDEAKPDERASAPMRTVFDAWLEHQAPNLERSTIVGYEQKIRLYLEPELGDVPLGELTTYRIDQAYTRIRKLPSRRGGRLSTTTVHHCHAILHAALEQAVAWDWIPKNPADHARSPGVAEGSGRAPDEDEAVLILTIALARADAPPAEHPDPLIGLFVVLAIAIGARRGALCALRWTDFDWKRGTVTLRRALTDAGGEVVEKGPKTKKPPRPKQLDTETLELLKARHLDAKKVALELGRPLAKDAYVFSYDGVTPVAPGAMGHRFARLAEKHALGIRFHDLRHFSVTHLLGKNIPVRDVSERHDHSSPRMTLERYGHAVPANDQAAAAEMGRVVARARGRSD